MDYESQVRAYKNALASVALEGNETAQMHLNIVETFNSVEDQYNYLTYVFNEIKNRVEEVQYRNTYERDEAVD